jgi:hypothetical protein
MARSLTVKYDPSPYWRVVEDSLVEIHALSRGEARNLVAELQDRLNALPPDIDQDIIYHDEPINVAADLVDRDLPEAIYRERYDRILRRHAPFLRLRSVAQSTSA